MSQERNILLTGRPDLPKDPIELKAGPLKLIYENGGIRYIKNGSVEILRMIYSAVRDHNWGTIPPQIRDEQFSIKDNAFEINYKVDYQKDNISFEADYTITGTSEGVIQFSMKGKSFSSFKKNRIGFCVLHPIKECAGNPCQINHPDGSTTKGSFPKYISPHQPFKNIQSITWEPEENVKAELIFSGDIFEMEDQRNWTDASYKTYCTPLDLPFPVQIDEGQVIEQNIELKVEAPSSKEETQSLKFEILDNTINLPPVGIGASTSKASLDHKSISLLKNLNLNHYRIDIDFTNTDWQDKLKAETSNAKSLNLKLEIALHISEKNTSIISDCLGQLKTNKKDLFSITLFNSDKKSTDDSLIKKVIPQIRDAFSDIKIGAGTHCFFTELNRERPGTEHIDYLTFSTNPQVHAFDDRSLTETLEAQRDVVESAKQFSDGKGIHVSPVTFKMRFNPNATGEAPPVPEGVLPPQVDPRQMSLYGAAWTLGSIKYLSESGANAITYFETVGWRGLIQGDIDSPLMDKFMAVKGDIFPTYQIFKWILEYKSSKVIPVKSSDPLTVDGLLLEQNNRRRFLIANYTLEVQKIKVDDIPHTVTFLDENDVVKHRKDANILEEIIWDHKEIVLNPYAIACLDYE